MFVHPILEGRSIGRRQRLFSDRAYIEPAKQTPEVQEQLRAITPTSLDPEAITFLDPACGSAHILVEAYDLFKVIYQERGYRAKDIPRLILGKNLFGLEIDDRAAQLAAFALMMKARADDRRIFHQEVQPQVRAFVQTDGMDAEDVAAALNVPASKESPPPGQLFETEDNLFTRAASMAVRSPYISLKDVRAIVELFQHAKTFGSLIQVPAALSARLPQIEQRCSEVTKQTDEMSSRTAAMFLPVIEQTRMLAGLYNCVVANPPYMGSKYLNGPLKAFVGKYFVTAKADLYACFILRNVAFARLNSFVGMITVPNWMFLSSFEEVRRSLFEEQTIDSFIHNGRGVFGSDFGSCSFVIRTLNVPSMLGEYRRLFVRQGSVVSNEELERKFFDCDRFNACPADFKKLPGDLIAYWLSDSERDAFASSKSLSEVAQPRQGLATTDDERFVRIWTEVAFTNTCLSAASAQEAISSGRKWFPFNKGGVFRRWFGNLLHVINWANDGAELKQLIRDRYGSPSKRIYNEASYFKPGVTYSNISISEPSFRCLPPGCVISHVGQAIYSEFIDPMLLLGYLNSRVVTRFLEVLSPTSHFEAGQIANLPFRSPGTQAIENVRSLVDVFRDDWNSTELSWDFDRCPLLCDSTYFVEAALINWTALCNLLIDKARRMEEENNHLFVECFGLQEQLSAIVHENQITLTRPDRTEDIKRLISYAVGCTMGRYSLDTPGLIYANGGNVGFDPGQYRTFPADPDGIVPVMDADWFSDDAANRLVEFLGVAWPREGLDENLKFVADALGPSRGEQPRDTIRRYLATGFFKHHLQTYKRRPIYWLFSSGKQRAFQCLVYLHRYHEGTLARMRTEYVIPLQGKIAGRIDQLAGDIAKPSSTSHLRKLQKAQDDLKKQQVELLAFDEKLKHFADMRISLDLDDGVKANYRKFGDLLAEVKAVTGGGDEE